MYTLHVRVQTLRTSSSQGGWSVGRGRAAAHDGLMSSPVLCWSGALQPLCLPAALMEVQAGHSACMYTHAFSGGGGESVMWLSGNLFLQVTAVMQGMPNSVASGRNGEEGGTSITCCAAEPVNTANRPLSHWIHAGKRQQGASSTFLQVYWQAQAHRPSLQAARGRQSRSVPTFAVPVCLLLSSAGAALCAGLACTKGILCRPGLHKMIQTENTLNPCILALNGHELRAH